MSPTRVVALLLLSVAMAAAVIAVAWDPSTIDVSPVVAARGVSTDATSDNGQKKLARTDHGTIYLAVSGPVDEVEQAQVLFSIDGGRSWKPDVVLAQPGVWSDLPTLAAGDGGRIDAAWVDYSGVGHVWYASKQNEEWSDFVKISPGETYAGFPAMVIRDGVASLLWYAAPPDETREHGSAYEIFHSELFSGGWTTPELLSEGSEDALNPSLAQGPDSVLHGAWFQVEQGVYRAQHAVFDGEGWTVPALVSIREGTATGVAVEVDTSGVTHMVWEQAMDGSVGVAYARLEGGVWSEPVMLSDARAQDPVLAFDEEGQVGVVWSEDGEIMARLFDGGWSPASALGPGVSPSLLSGEEILATWTRDTTAGAEVVITPLTRGKSSGTLLLLWAVAAVSGLGGLALMVRRRSVGDAGDGED
jgi:hypothetical protein